MERRRSSRNKPINFRPTDEVQALINQWRKRKRNVSKRINHALDETFRLIRTDHDKLRDIQQEIKATARAWERTRKAYEHDLKYLKREERKLKKKIKEGKK